MEKYTASIETLVKQSQSGNEQAFHSLYDILADRVFLFVRSRTRQRDDALDILQDIFVDFWNGIRGFTFSSDSKLYAYLYTIASRKIGTYYKHREHGAENVAIDDIEDFLADPHEKTEEEKKDILDIKRSLAQVDQKDREIIELRYFSGLPFADIASVLDQTENTLKVRHHRALEKLRSIMHIQ